MKIAKPKSSEKYLELNSNTVLAGEANDCSVKTIAVVCNISYEEAHEACKLQGRKAGGAMVTGSILDAIQMLGFKTTSIKKTAFIDNYPGCHSNLKHVTTYHPKRFSEVWADGKVYVMFVKGHVLAIENGIMHDWSASRVLRAKSIYEVSK